MTSDDVYDYSFGAIDIWKFIQKENVVLIGKRSRRVVKKKLFEIYSDSFLTKNGLIELRNKEKEIPWYARALGLTTRPILIPRLINITPNLVYLSAYAESEFGKSPTRNSMWASSFHEEHLWLVRIMQKIFKIRPDDYIVAVQINRDVYDSLRSNKKLDSRLDYHWKKLNKILPREKLYAVRGTRFQSAKLDTLNFFYNPTLFELLISLTRTVLFTLPKLPKLKSKPAWFVGNISRLKMPICYVNMEKYAKSLSYTTKKGRTRNFKISKYSPKEFILSKQGSNKQILVRRKLPLNLLTLSWSSLMKAEGRKSGKGFTNSDPRLIKLFIRGIRIIFRKGLDSPFRGFELLIGEDFHKELHRKFRTSVENKVERKSFAYCTDDNIRNTLRSNILKEIPELNEMRLLGIRVDTFGKKRVGITVDIFLTGTITEFLSSLVNSMIYNLNYFVKNFSQG